jgi:hypothetical protein
MRLKRFGINSQRFTEGFQGGLLLTVQQKI